MIGERASTQSVSWKLNLNNRFKDKIVSEYRTQIFIYKDRSINLGHQ